MQSRARILNKENIETELQKFCNSITTIGNTVQGVSGVALLEKMKREKVGAGPYPDVSLFEAANRIMTDLVIYSGVRCLLENNKFPFKEYSVEFGHENNKGFDLRANEEGKNLIGEAFNVASSFFQNKKTSMLKKLRSTKADFYVIMANQSAVSDGYFPKVRTGEFYVFVNTDNGICRIFPEKVLL